MRAYLACPLLVASLLLACSSSSGPVVLSGDPDAGTANTDAAPIVCTNIGYVGSPITPVAVMGAAPTALGGTIADGTYRLTAYKAYNEVIDPSQAFTVQGSIKFAAGTYETAFLAGSTEDNESGTVALSGTSLTLTASCPAALVGKARRYSVSGTSFDLYDDAAGTGATDKVEVATYTRQ